MAKRPGACLSVEHLKGPRPGDAIDQLNPFRGYGLVGKHLT